MRLTLKKSYGQHFLHDKNIARRIVNEALRHNPPRLLEIGPGGGALTEIILEEYNAHFKAIEIDKEKVDFLIEKFPQLYGKIILQDFLKSDLPWTEKFAVVGNFPYNISTEIVFKLIDWRDHITSVTGMFQKEVAQRLSASPGSKTYGITSVICQAFFEIEYLFDVSRGAFTPPPKVTSGTIRLTPLKETVDMKSEALFKTLVKTSFGQRRKQLRNTLKPFFTPEQLDDAFFTKRPEELSVQDFARLSFEVETDL